MSEDYMVCTECGRQSSSIYSEEYGKVRLCKTCKSKRKADGYECPCGEWDAPSNLFRGSLREGLCFDCSFWEDRLAVAQAPDSGSIRVDGHHYQVDIMRPIKGGNPSHRGFAGRTWRIRFHDGRTVLTDNLWYQGVIPERFRDRLPDNAELEAAS